MKLSIPTVLLVCASLACAAPIAEPNAIQERGTLEKREPVAGRQSWSKKNRSRGRTGRGRSRSRTSSRSSTSAVASATVSSNATVATLISAIPSATDVGASPPTVTDEAYSPAPSEVDDDAPVEEEEEEEEEEEPSSPAPSAAAPAQPSAVRPGSAPASSAAAAPSSVPAAPAVPGNVWQPKVAEPFQIILSALPDPKVDVIPQNVNIFDIDMFAASPELISALKAKGKKVMCYFSAGSSEDWRPDHNQFTAADQGLGIAKDDSGSSYWPGEKWLNIKNPNPAGGNLPNVWKIMQARIKLAADKGCDAVDPDNMDAYNNKNGLDLTAQDSVNYFNFMADESAKLGMAIGLKNSLEILPQVQAKAQFAVNEECAAWNECHLYNDFLNTKPVFHIEYVDSKSETGVARRSNSPLQKRAGALAALSSHCTPKNAPVLGPKFSTVIKLWELDGWVQFCDGTTVETKTVGK